MSKFNSKLNAEVLFDNRMNDSSNICYFGRLQQSGHDAEQAEWMELEDGLEPNHYSMVGEYGSAPSTWCFYPDWIEVCDY